MAAMRAPFVVISRCPFWKFLGGMTSSVSRPSSSKTRECLLPPASPVAILLGRKQELGNSRGAQLGFAQRSPVAGGFGTLSGSQSQFGGVMPESKPKQPPEPPEVEEVDESSEESFPASDAPSWAMGKRTDRTPEPDATKPRPSNPRQPGNPRR